MRKLDLTGLIFGRLTVLNEAEPQVSASGQKRIMWNCKCECGNYTVVSGAGLRSGSTKSCGCLQKELAREKRIKDPILINGVGYDYNGNIFYYDIEDEEILKDYCWRKRQDGYFDAKLRDGSGKRIMMHDLIMKSKYVDHINGEDSRNDNRKENLRLADSEYSFETYNNINKKIQRNNKSGHPGVTWHSRDNVWEVFISINNKQIYLGRYDNYDEALAVRLKAEDEYFGNWKYNYKENK